MTNEPNDTAQQHIARAQERVLTLAPPPVPPDVALVLIRHRIERLDKDLAGITASPYDYALLGILRDLADVAQQLAGDAA